MKPNIAFLLLCVAAHTFSCSAPGEVVPSRTAGGVQKSTNSAPLLLSDKDGRVQVTISTSGKLLEEAGGVGLRAFEEILLDVPGRYPSPPKAAGRQLAAMWLDGEALETAATNSLMATDRRSSNDWEFVSFDLAPGLGVRVTEFRRHLLYVQPDLIVVCDEISFREPTAVQTGWWFPNELVFDPVRDEWRLQLGKAGLTARVFGSPGEGVRLMQGPDAVKNGAVSELKCLRAGVTNRIPEYRQITVLVPHQRDARRSLVFKLLESDTAIGVRVHRDGLPTLVAFRKSTTSGEASLTGLKFSDPVAVDIFRPKHR